MDGTSHQQRNVQFEGDEHTQGEGQGRHLAPCQHDGHHGTNAIEQPRSTHTVHQRLDDSRHGVGLRGGQLTAGESVGLIEDDHHSAYGSCRHQCAEELPRLLLGRRSAQPVANLQVGDESAGHRQSCTYHTAHDEGCQHAARTVQAYGHHHDRSQDEGHQRHAAHGVGAYNGDGVGGHGGEEEGDDGDEQDAHQGMNDVTLHHIQIEEEEGEQDGDDRTDGDDFERDVALGAQLSLVDRLAAFHLLCGQSDGTLDDAPALDDADDAGHGNAADTYRLTIGFEDLLGTHVGHGRGDGGVPLVQYRVGEDERQSRYDEPPHRERAQTDNERILEADDVAQTQHCGARVHFEHQLRLVGQHLAPAHDARGEALVPPAKGGHDEVVESAHDAGNEQRLGLVATLGTADEHLCGGCRLGEGILAVHVADEVFAERDEEQDADDTAQQRADEHLHERDSHLGILSLQDIDGRQGEDGTSHDDARAGTYRLDDDVLAQRVLSLRGRRHTHGDDGDGNGSLEHLAHLQSQVGSSGREDHGHDDTPRHRPRVDLRIGLARVHDGLVLFSVFQFPERVVGQLHDVFFVFHILIL